MRTNEGTKEEELREAVRVAVVVAAAVVVVVVVPGLEHISRSRIPTLSLLLLYLNPLFFSPPSTVVSDKPLFPSTSSFLAFPLT